MNPLVLPSASELTRAIKCEPSEVITPVVVEESNQHSRRGDTIHDFVKHVGSGKSREEALAALEEDDPNLPAAAAFDVTAIPRGGHFEVALAWDWRVGRGRVLGHDLGRDYSRADRAAEYVGSFDYAAELRPTEGVIADWKSGWRTIPAKDSWQLLAGAVFAADTWGWQLVHAAHLDVRDPERPRWDMVEIDSLQLAAARQRLRDYAERRILQWDSEQSGQAMALRVVEGDHCRYCKAWKACPAKVALARQLGGDGLQLLPPPGEVTTETLRRAVHTLLRVEELLPRAWKEVEAFARITPIDLGDGRVMKLAPGRKADKVTDAAAVLEVLRSVIGTEHAAKALSTTKGKIEEAAASYAREKGLPIGKSKQQAVEALRGRGLIEKQQAEDSVQIVKVDDGG